MGTAHAFRMIEKPVPYPFAAASPIIPLPRTAAGTVAWGPLATTNRRPDSQPDTGVHLPFIAPMLCGVRVRPGRQGLEFILPNPSGGRGVYVAAWSVVTGFAVPSLHDTLLVGRLSGLDAIGPADVRQAAHAVALDGYAGHEATMAAQQVRTALDTASLRLRAQFLLTLARRGGFHRPDEAARCLDRDGFNILAGRLGWRGPQLAEALQLLSVQYASVAVGAGGTIGGSAIRGADGGRWKRLLSLVRRLRLSLAEEQFCRSGSDGLVLARVIAAADRCIEQAEQLLPGIEAMLADPLPLLEAWRDGGASASWLPALENAFDGWDRLCLLWFDACTPRARQSLIPEIAALARAGGNGDSWSPPGRQGTSGDTEDGPGSEGRRQLVVRNERVRAQELSLEFETI